MARKINLMVIDPQRSFCAVVDPLDQQKVHDGELCVPGAWDDCVRIANMVKRLGRKIDDIHVTMDSHHYLHIAHPIWFRDTKGNQPDPFTSLREEKGVIIGAKYDASGTLHDVGEYTTIKPSLLKWTLDYLKSLATNKRYAHMIWPPHCLIGTKGHTIVEPLFDAFLAWEKENVGYVNYVTKGSNYRVEHFSAVQAEVPDPMDAVNTGLNTDFIGAVMEADEILLCGEASSHCLSNTVTDMANSFKDDSFIKKCVLLTDGTSAVTGLKFLADNFIKAMTARGMQLSTTVDYLA
jgi:nicotinamidase-related amidase